MARLDPDRMIMVPAEVLADMLDEALSGDTEQDRKVT